VIKEIRKDTGTGRQMNRLLQGDVGSGKTIVALLIILLAIDNHYQCCMMAPTEILARHTIQHLHPAEGLTGHCTIADGSTKAAEKRAILKQLEEGSLIC